MKKQRGQAMVEFALIAPMIFLMIFGMIWGGYMFMEYLRFSNDVRAAVRDMALASSTDRVSKATAYVTELEKTYEKELPNLYKPNIVVDPGTDDGDKDVTITITFTRRNDLPAVLMWVNFPPEKIPPIQYKMRLEHSSSSSNSTSSSNT